MPGMYIGLQLHFWALFTILHKQMFTNEQIKVYEKEILTEKEATYQ